MRLPALYATIGCFRISSPCQCGAYGDSSPSWSTDLGHVGATAPAPGTGHVRRIAAEVIGTFPPCEVRGRQTHEERARERGDARQTAKTPVTVPPQEGAEAVNAWQQGGDLPGTWQGRGPHHRLPDV